MAGFKWIHPALWLIFSSAIFVEAFPTSSEPETTNVTTSNPASTNETLSLSIFNEEPAQEKMDDVSDAIEEVAPPPPPPPPQPTVRILPPVEMMVENEIWQYRYPPFDNLFTPVDEHAARGTGVEQDVLPSYVIGVLDPAELVDGLFQQRHNRQNGRNSVVTPIEFPGPVDNDADIRGGKSVSLQLTPASGSRSTLVPDDRWIWKS